VADVREAVVVDCAVIGRLLDDFNNEYGDSTPGAEVLAARVAECYLAELYIAPSQRGRGLGRALMEASIDLARRQGADHMDLGTGETDTAARALYESLGFDNHEGRPDGPINYYYEREL
jgi:ribosomal protein S18 acetylase RimI-like enzyme